MVLLTVPGFSLQMSLITAKKKFAKNLGIFAPENVAAWEIDNGYKQFGLSERQTNWTEVGPNNTTINQHNPHTTNVSKVNLKHLACLSQRSVSTFEPTRKIHEPNLSAENIYKRAVRGKSETVGGGGVGSKRKNRRRYECVHQPPTCRHRNRRNDTRLCS